MAISGKHSWIENSDVVSLFPTLVWKIQLRAEVHEPIDAAALGLLRSLRQGQPELKSGEAWQSGHALHRREELHALCDCVSRAAASVLQFLKIGEPAIEITGCWVNLYAPGAAHREHSHPNNNHWTISSNGGCWSAIATMKFSRSSKAAGLTWRKS